VSREFWFVAVSVAGVPGTRRFCAYWGGRHNVGEATEPRLFYIGAYMANNERNSRSSERDVEQTTPPQPLSEDEENPEATVDQDPGERQKRNQGEEREDPLAA